MSYGRIYIMSMSAVNLMLAVAVAIRFSAVRRQFGPTDEEEVPVLEYPLQVGFPGALRPRPHAPVASGSCVSAAQTSLGG